MWFKKKSNNILFSYNGNHDKNSGDRYNIFWVLSIISIFTFIVIFHLYTEGNKNDFKNILKETETFYTNKSYYTNFKVETNNRIIITNIEFKTFENDDRINSRINLLGERIVHYQKTASDTLNWWIAILSILFILATGINFYSYNESKVKLEKAVEDAENLKRDLKDLIEKASNQFPKSTSDTSSDTILSEDNNSKKILKVTNTDSKRNRKEK